MEHYLFRCSGNGVVWTYQRNCFLQSDRRLRGLQIDAWIYPVLRLQTRQARQHTLEILASMLCYMTEVDTADKSLEHYKFFLQCK